MTTQTIPVVIPKQTRLIVAGISHGSGFQVGYVPAGESARKVYQGPLVPGPWAYAYPLCSVISTDGGTSAEMAREKAAGLLLHVALGDRIEVEGLAYAVKATDRYNIELIQAR